MSEHILDLEKEIELTSIDFTKYEKLILDKVVITISRSTKIEVNKDGCEDISIIGFSNNQYNFSTHYNKDELLQIFELNNTCLVIRREEGKR